MNAEETKSLIPYAEAAEKKWFLNRKPAKPVKEVNVRFTNGKSYRYLSKIECTPDDVLTIDYGGATSCCMGQVEKVGRIEHLKPLSAIRTLFVFSTDPGKREIKRNVSAYKAMDSRKLITDYNSYACCIVDRFIAKVLDSITVLAFPEFVDDEAIAEAKKYLETKCFLPAELIRENQTRNLDIVFPGYYPGWLEDFKSLNFWNKDFVKTEVARYIADILYENGILPTNRMIEVDRNGLVSQYYGATAEKASRVIESAWGGVLFIDEAYSLINPDASQSDYGKEAVDTLVKAMEDYRGKFCVILAGYKNEMLKMLSSNPGFNSRIQFMLDFPNYSRDELKEIANLMLGQRQYSIGDEALNRILDITDIKRKEPNFANARELRNILDQVIMCQNLRCLGSDDHEIGLVDVNKYIGDAKLNLPTSDGKKEGSVLTGEEELDRLIGLATVKRMIKKIKAYAKRNKDSDGFNLHMCFYGNPGTGKTEVARILSRILYDAGVLGEAKLVETDAHGLLGRCVGETAPKTEAKINEAMNGVLFIDEAYRLSGSAESGSTANYGEEAISVLLKEMEDHRGQFCAILAGYRDEMRDMLKLNPGFESRIQFNLEFPDYNRDELREISKCFLSKRKYEIKENALELLLDITEYYRNKPNFANARTVRNIVDQVIMNQNLRTEDSAGDNTILVDDVEDYLIDENIDLENKKHTDNRIGFV